MPAFDDLIAGFQPFGLTESAVVGIADEGLQIVRCDIQG